MSIQKEENDLFMIDKESLSNHSQEIKKYINLKTESKNNTWYDFRVDIRAYANMERSSQRKEVLRKDTDSSVNDMADMTIIIKR